MRTSLTGIALCVAVFLVLSLSRQGQAEERPAGNGPQAAASVTPYPLDTCIVAGEKLGGDMGKPVVMVYKGREIKFCCKGCVPKFQADPEKYMKALDAAIAAKAAAEKK